MCSESRRWDSSLDDSRSDSSTGTDSPARTDSPAGTDSPARTDSSAADPLPVLVIGGGITGLLIGQAHRKAGTSCTIFESELSDSRRHDWTIAVHWSLSFLQKILPASLYDRLPEAYCDPSHEFGPGDGVSIYNGETGDLLKKIVSHPMIRVSRRKMRTLCSEGLTIEYGKTLERITYSANGLGITAHFADGSSAKGGVLVGADGPVSKVRDILLGAEKAETKTLGLNFYSFLVKYDDAEKARHVRSLHPITALTYHPEGIFAFISVQDVPDPASPETWTFQLACSWMGERATSIETLKQKMECFVEPYRSAFAWIPGETKLNFGRIRYWTPTPWDNHEGRVTLVGDAAHPLPPHRGQGLNVCIHDVYHLFETLTKVRAGGAKLAEAVAEYDVDLVKRGAAEVHASVETTLMIHDWSKMMDSPVMQQGLTRT